MELHPSGAPSSEAGGSTVSMEEPVNQRGAQNHWTEGASSEETLTLKQEEEEEEEEERQDIKPILLPKPEPMQHQEEGGGGQEGQKSLSVVIKTEQGGPEESSSFIHVTKSHCKTVEKRTMRVLILQVSAASRLWRNTKD
ncbi:hypothetical protein MHYP_G00104250 [Metynnis hypsauchen]